MREEYTMTTDDNGDARVCPFRLASSGTHCDCMGRRCMAWVVQLDDSGKPTGNGRCGMVGRFQVSIAYASSDDDIDEDSDDDNQIRASGPIEMVAKVGDKYPPDFPKAIDVFGREILHCPNCGSVKVSMQRDVGASYVECEECGMRGPVKRTPEPALQEWNGLPRAVLCCGNKDMEE